MFSVLVDQVTSLKQTIEDKQLEISELTGKVSTLNVELDKLKSKGGDLNELVRLANGQTDIDLKRKEIEFEYRLGGVAAFLSSEEEKRVSEFFFCNNLAWSVSVYKKLYKSTEYLAVYLKAANFVDAIWSTEVTFKCTILSHSPGGNRGPWKCQFSDRYPSWGWGQFLTIVALRSDGFIINDEIKIRVYLKIDETKIVINGN